MFTLPVEKILSTWLLISSIASTSPPNDDHFSQLPGSFAHKGSVSQLPLGCDSILAVPEARGSVG